jgi:hypothetical protein
MKVCLRWFQIANALLDLGDLPGFRLVESYGHSRITGNPKTDPRPITTTHVRTATTA